MAGMDLTGIRVIVCGAAGGIGAGAVRDLSARGARVAAIYNNTPPADDLRAAARWYQGDLTRKATVDALFDTIAADLGGIDALVQPAGTWRIGRPEDVDDELLDFLFATNVKSTIYTNQAAWRHMKAGGGGRIVNFGSVEGMEGSSLSTAYATTRGAVHAWTRSAAHAWGADKVTVNAIAPFIMTPLFEMAQAKMSPEQRAASDSEMGRRVPVGGKPGDPLRDCAPAVAFLVSPDSHFITGQLIPVDGGYRMVGA